MRTLLSFALLTLTSGLALADKSDGGIVTALDAVGIKLGGLSTFSA